MCYTLVMTLHAGFLELHGVVTALHGVVTTLHEVVTAFHTMFLELLGVVTTKLGHRGSTLYFTLLFIQNSYTTSDSELVKQYYDFFTSVCDFVLGQDLEAF